MPKYVLHYFPFPGRAECIRHAFRVGKIDFEEKNYTFPEFMEAKKSGLFPYGSIPVLEIDGKMFAQSNALLNYVGKLANLIPEDDLERLQADEFCAAVEDIYHGFTPSLAPGLSEDAKKEMRAKFQAGILTTVTAYLEKCLNAKSAFFVGSQLSVADLKIVPIFVHMTSGTVDYVDKAFLDAFPNVQRVLANVLATLPQAETKKASDGGAKGKAKGKAKAKKSAPAAASAAPTATKKKSKKKAAAKK